MIVDFGGCNHVIDPVIEQFVPNCPHLTTALLWGTEITDVALLHMKNHCKHIETLVSLSSLSLSVSLFLSLLSPLSPFTLVFFLPVMYLSVCPKRVDLMYADK